MLNFLYVIMLNLIASLVENWFILFFDEFCHLLFYAS